MLNVNQNIPKPPPIWKSILGLGGGTLLLASSVASFKFARGTQTLKLSKKTNYSMPLQLGIFYHDLILENLALVSGMYGLVSGGTGLYIVGKTCMTLRSRRKMWAVNPFKERKM
jgi:hypothetical protein